VEKCDLYQKIGRKKGTFYWRSNFSLATFSRFKRSSLDYSQFEKFKFTL